MNFIKTWCFVDISQDGTTYIKENFIIFAREKIENDEGLQFPGD